MIYRDLPSVDFSGRVLAEFPTEFAILPVSGVSWSDLGDPQRLLAAISRSGRYISGGSQNVPRSQSLALPSAQEQITRSKASEAQR
jgi:hypothetical protein